MGVFKRVPGPWWWDSASSKFINNMFDILRGEVLLKMRRKQHNALPFIASGLQLDH